MDSDLHVVYGEFEQDRVRPQKMKYERRRFRKELNVERTQVVPFSRLMEDRSISINAARRFCWIERELL